MQFWQAHYFSLVLFLPIKGRIIACLCDGISHSIIDLIAFVRLFKRQSRHLWATCVSTISFCFINTNQSGVLECSKVPTEHCRLIIDVNGGIGSATEDVEVNCVSFKAQAHTRIAIVETPCLTKQMDCVQSVRPIGVTWRLGGAPDRIST